LRVTAPDGNFHIVEIIGLVAGKLSMTKIVEMDETGRVVIPKEIRLQVLTRSFGFETTLL